MLVTLIGVPASVVVAINNYNSAANRHRAAQCIAQQARSGYTFKLTQFSGFDYSAGGCSHTSSLAYLTTTSVIKIADAPAPTFRKGDGLTPDGLTTIGIGLMITGVLAIIAYVGFWLLGRLCAGLTRDA